MNNDTHPMAWAPLMGLIGYLVMFVVAGLVLYMTGPFGLAIPFLIAILKPVYDGFRGAL